jgi:nuclear pore complex protein Nup53
MTQAPQATPHQAPELLYVIVFGYPPDKYSVAVEYFKQLGETTDPDPNTEISNCFKIGFKNPVEAVWAVRKNGEVVGGSWMVGVKWAVRHRLISLLDKWDQPPFLFFFQDLGQADRVLGQAAARTAYPLVSDVSSPPDIMPTDSTGPSRSSHQLTLPAARSPHHNTPTVGTPIRLAPSASAFRKPGQTPKTATSTPELQPPAFPAVGAPGTPSKGMLGQFSDLVFGW